MMSPVYRMGIRIQIAWLRLHKGILDSNPDSDHLSCVDCDPESNLDLVPGVLVYKHAYRVATPL